MSLLDTLTGLDNRALCDTGRLVRADHVQQPVAINLALAGLDNDLLARDFLDPSAMLGDNNRSRVERRTALHPCLDQRGVRTKCGNGLPLHIRPHQGTVRIVVLEKRDQRGTDRDELLRRDIHVVHLFGGYIRILVVVANLHLSRDERPIGVQTNTGRADIIVVLVIGGQPV